MLLLRRLLLLLRRLQLCCWLRRWWRWCWRLAAVHARWLINDGHIGQGALKQRLQNQLRLMILRIVGIMTQYESFTVL